MPKSAENLINLINTLPGIGPKASLRIVLFLVNNPHISQELSHSMLDIVQNIGKCRLCGNLADKGKLCSICSDPKRDKSKVALLSNISDLMAIEKTMAYNGLYFIFNDLSQFFDNDQILNAEITRLFYMIKFFESQENASQIKEIIFAFPHNIDSEVVSSMISEQLSEKLPYLSVSRIAYGMPSGADFDYTDKLTIVKSFKGRSPLQS
jgi:recombination protein RecR